MVVTLCIVAFCAVIMAAKAIYVFDVNSKMYVTVCTELAKGFSLLNNLINSSIIMNKTVDSVDIDTDS